jgi:hypothetical protein
MARNPFYNTTAWKRLRKVKLLRNPLCEDCRKPARDVDHVKSINAGGDALALENLRSLCHECHSRKTLYIDRMKKDRVPVTGCNPDGTPLDPEHWWNDKKSLRADASDRARSQKES